MMDNELINIQSPKEMGSFLLPAYGFQTPWRAKDYKQALSSARYQEIRFLGKSYVPRSIRESDQWSADGTFDRMYRSVRQSSFSYPLSEIGQEMPPGTHNVAILVEGRRSFYRRARYTDDRPKWWHDIGVGFRDCYAVWGRNDQPMIPNGMGISTACDPKRILFERQGRGALYAYTTMFNNDGAVEGFETQMILVQFSMRDGGAEDRALRVNVVANQVLPSHDPMNVEPPFVDGLDKNWQAIVERAQEGFELYCHPVPEDVEKRRKILLRKIATQDAGD